MYYLGRRWEFVWGEGSRNYSEEVIKSYICRHGSIVEQRNDRKNKQRELNIVNLAAIHVGGSTGNIANRPYGLRVAKLVKEGRFSLLTYVHMPICILNRY